VKNQPNLTEIATVLRPIWIKHCMLGQGRVRNAEVSEKVGSKEALCSEISFAVDAKNELIM
jgi:hypothetical protein